MAKKSPNNGQRRKKKRHLGLIIFFIFVLFGAAAAGMVYYAYQQDLAVDRSPIVIVDGVNISGISEDEAVKRIMDKYPWSIKVVYDGGEYPIDNILTPMVESAVKRAKKEEQSIIEAEKSLTTEERIKRLSEDVVRQQINIDLDAIENTDFLAAEVAGELGDKLGSEPEDATLSSYDPSSGFVYTEGKEGYEADTYKLAADIKEALEGGNYTAEIPVKMKSVAPSVTKDQYKKIGAYTTRTTNNENRNTNVRLAAQAINGHIIQPGERFSFNETVGKRTPEKGYKEAGAYADGVTVQEYGGGVCQISSTLYNAVISAGLETNERTGHTFEPSYVTPGQDATVSYMQPDFVFTNTSGHPIGILASYANRVVTVELYGIPILEEGQKMYLHSEKTGEVGAGYDYVEDGNMPFGAEEIVSNAKPGSVWQTYVVIEKDGKVVEREYLHTTRYRGHNGTIRRNTTNPLAPPAPPAPPAPAPVQ